MNSVYSDQRIGQFEVFLCYRRDKMFGSFLLRALICVLLLNNEELSGQQIPCVRGVNKSWNKKNAKTSPLIKTGRESYAASVCQQSQLKLS